MIATRRSDGDGEGRGSAPSEAEGADLAGATERPGGGEPAEVVAAGGGHEDAAPATTPEAAPEAAGEVVVAGEETVPARGRGLRRVVVTGAAKGLGTLLCRRLAGSYDLIGIDGSERDDPGVRHMDFYRCDLTTRAAEDVFRCGEVDAVVHLAFQDDPRASAHERYNSNVMGTMRLLDYVQRYAVRQVVVLSTAAVYGAHPHHPTFIREDAPLRSVETYSGLRDRVEADRYAQAFMWRRSGRQVIILRPTNILGPTITNSLKRYLRARVAPVLLGFDPMLQVVHEDDVVRAIELALDSEWSGIYNVPGPSEVSLRTALRETGAEPFPISHVLAYPMARALWRLHVMPFPAPEIDFLRYSCIISGEKIRRDLGYEPQVSLRATLRSIRRQPR